jgi:hypothetical protein
MEGTDRSYLNYKNREDIMKSDDITYKWSCGKSQVLLYLKKCLEENYPEKTLKDLNKEDKEKLKSALDKIFEGIEIEYKSGNLLIY